MAITNPWDKTKIWSPKREREPYREGEKRGKERRRRGGRGRRWRSQDQAKVWNYMVLYGTTWNSKVLYEFPCLYSYYFVPKNLGFC